MVIILKSSSDSPFTGALHSYFEEISYASSDYNCLHAVQNLEKVIERVSKQNSERI